MNLLALVSCTVTILAFSSNAFISKSTELTNSTSSINSSDLLRHGNGFPLTHFVVSTDNNVTYFNLRNKSGMVYKIVVDYLFRELAWIGENDIYLTVNVSRPIAVFLTKCNDQPISLKPSVIYQEYKLSRKCLDAEEGCVNLHLIATEGPVNGQISVDVKPTHRLFHLQIIFAVTFCFVMFMLLLRQCANQLLRIVYSYDPMEECQP